MSDLQPVIGLEIHCQLQTESRLFSTGPVAYGAPANSQLTPYDIGMPGTLPVLNERAVDLAVRAGLALDCTVHRTSRFDRKHYFYPDLPKGYQITQYTQPICTDGALVFDCEGEEKKTAIQRIHLEEDAGKSIRDEEQQKRLVDYNRAGIALIEIVTEPDLRTPKQAEAALRALHRLVVHLGICDGNLQEGSFRCDANVSLTATGGGEKPLGGRTELKNLNSFRFVRRALQFEIDRHRSAHREGALAPGGETRKFDAHTGRTLPMRTKETSPDYRYMPDPDLPALRLGDQRVERVEKELPELPRARRRRFVDDMGLSRDDADTLVDSPARADFFDRAAGDSDHPAAVANFIINELLSHIGDHETVDALAIAPGEVAHLVSLVDDDVLSSSAASTVLDEMIESGESADAVVERLDLRQITDQAALQNLVDTVMDDHPEIVERYRSGEKKLLGFFMGRVMEASAGRADPEKANRLLRQRLEE